MLWIKLKPDDAIDVLDEQGNPLGVITAYRRGGSVRVSFDGLKHLVFKRRAAPEPEATQPRKSA